MGKIWEFIGLTPTKHMKNGDLGDDMLIKLQSVFSPPGFGQHLVAVELWSRRLIGAWNDKTQDAALSLLSWQPNNPFFEFIARGKTERAAALTLKYCPTFRPERASQWSCIKGRYGRGAPEGLIQRCGSGAECCRSRGPDVSVDISFVISS